MRTLTVLGLALGLSVLAAACGGDDTSATGSGGSTSSGTGGSGGQGGAGGAGGSGGSTPGALSVSMYASDPSGPLVNSVLVTGETDAILVDGQFLKADAAAVVDMVNTSGKTLKAIFLTHAHPDHYIGLVPIQEAFPGVKVLTTQAVLDEYNAKAPGTLQYLKGIFGDQIADTLAAPEVATEGDLDLEGHAIQIIEMPEPGESVAAAALGLTDMNAIIAGDVVYNEVHLVLAECAQQGWLTNLDAVKAMGFETIYPGHGAAATMATLDADAQYINDVVPIMDAAATPDEAKAAIKVAYPTYASEYLLNFSVDTYFQQCKPAP